MRKLTAALCVVLLIAGLAACSSNGASDSSTSTSDGPAEGTTATTEGGSGVDGEAAAFTTALSEGLAAGDPDDGDLEVSEDEAACIAPQWIGTIGVDALVEGDVSPSDLEDPDFSFPGLGLGEDQGFDMIDAFVDCDVDIYEQFDDVVTEDLTDTQAACLRGEMDEDLARRFLAEAAIDDELSSGLEATLDAIDEKCKLSEE
ncbi:MAG: hypothetical protein JWM47_1489 [Acidimicrobiales bacterium]|nr:hypothetical protein [Acidimicrobiales bacterium]